MATLDRTLSSPAIIDQSNRSRLQQRRIGKSDINISVVGFGAWGIGGLTPNATSYGETDDNVSRRALSIAFERGINFFDTSPAYGNGRSERLIGETLAGVRSDIAIATKGGIASFDEPADFTPAALRRGLMGSLKRLRSDFVDLYQLHNPDATILDNPEPVASLFANLRADGLIRAFGISVGRPEDGIIAINRFDVDAIQVNFNLLDQRVVDCGLMDLAQARNVAIVARTPLCFGFLSGAITRDAVFDPSDHRSRWPRAQIASWIEASDRFLTVIRASDSTTSNKSRASLALRFCISFDPVAVTIPGIMTEDDAGANIVAAIDGPLSQPTIAAIRQAYRDQSIFLDRTRTGR